MRLLGHLVAPRVLAASKALLIGVVFVGAPVIAESRSDFIIPCPPAR